MPDHVPWRSLAERAGALDDSGSVDDVARVSLRALAAVDGVPRVAIAVASGAGRRLEFVPSESLGPGPLGWCEIDALADVPLAKAALTGRPVVLHDLDELQASYPHLRERQEALGTRALAAIPLEVGHERLGALLVAADRPGAFAPVLDGALLSFAEHTAQALHRVLHARTEQVPDALDAAEDGAASTVLPTGAVAPRAGRRFLRRQAEQWGLDAATVEAAELALSEVVTNAVVHARTGVRVDLRLEPDGLRVEVTDRGTDSPVRRVQVPDADDVGGRGLLIVDALTRAWGSNRSDGGTTVWFEVGPDRAGA